MLSGDFDEGSIHEASLFGDHALLLQFPGELLEESRSRIWNSVCSAESACFICEIISIISTKNKKVYQNESTSPSATW